LILLLIKLTHHLTSSPENAHESQNRNIIRKK